MLMLAYVLQIALCLLQVESLDCLLEPLFATGLESIPADSSDLIVDLLLSLVEFFKEHFVAPLVMCIDPFHL